MIIKCPQCSTGYSIPEKMVGDKPKKMRCSRCKHVFAIARRKESTPKGYEEFTGRQHLPDEFAFLKESKQEEASPPEPPAAPAAPPAAPPEPQQPPAPEEKRTPSGLYKALMDGAQGDTQTIPLEPKLVSKPKEKQTPPEPPPQAPPRAEPPQSPGAPPQAEPVTPAPVQEEARPTASSSVSDIYGGTASAWEMEAPLELGGYALEPEAPPKGQAAGKFITIIIILVAGFFAFVAYRNGWSLSPPNLGEQIAFAFSGQEYEQIPQEAEGIQAEVSNSKLITSKDGTTYLSVTGEVTNTASMGKSRIILKAKLVDSAGDKRAEARAPCGKVIEDSVIEETKTGAIMGHYRQGGETYNCVLTADGSTIFQIVFEDVPVDYDSSFKAVVTPASAKLGI